MKNLYEPPKSLMDEVQQNIFKRHANSELKYHGFAEITEKQPKKFYNLFEAAPASEFSSEIPKLDGLALSFILGTSESLKYAQLYQALIENLNVAKGDDLDQVILELCFFHSIFRFWFLVTFGDEVMKIRKYYVIFVYILQGKMGNGKKITQLK